MKKSLFVFPLFLVCVLMVNVSPSNGWLDTSALALGSHALGVGHPPGEPLYAVLGKMFQMIPVGNIALRMNLLSGVFLLLAFLFLFKIISIVNGKASVLYKFLALGSCLVVFLSYSFIVQGTRAELYSLNLFLSLAVLFCFIEEEYMLLGFFVLGLALGCHPLLTLALIPGLAVLVIRRPRRCSFYLKSLFFLMIGGSIYLYLPLRAASNPVYNFGNPDNLGRFVWVARGELYKAYENFQFSGLLDNAKNIFDLFAAQITPLVLILGAAGLFLLAIRNRRYGLAFFLILLANVYLLLTNMHFHAANPDAHGYLMISYGVFAVGFAFFLSEISAFRLGERIKILVACLGAVLLVSLCALQLVIHSPEYRAARRYSANVLGRDIIRNVPYGSVIFAGSFTTYSLASYLAFAENYRDDLKILFAGFMENDGYAGNVRANYPALAAATRSEFRFTNDTLLSLYEGNPLFVELSIKRDRSGYGIRYDPTVLKNLEEFQWFYRFVPAARETDRSGYESFWEERILGLYNDRDYELKKHILLELFLHSKYSIFRHELKRAGFLLDMGLEIAPDFEPFNEMKDELSKTGGF